MRKEVHHHTFQQTPTAGEGLSRTHSAEWQASGCTHRGSGRARGCARGCGRGRARGRVQPRASARGCGSGLPGRGPDPEHR